MTNDTLNEKRKALEENATKILAALQQNQAQAEQIAAQRRSLEQEQIANYGAQVLLKELLQDIPVLKEVSAD